MAWWHYTLGTRLVSIIADQKIKRATAGVSKGERKAVWFTCREDWESLVTPMRIDEATGDLVWATIEETIQLVGALVRIEVAEDVARHTWAYHRRLSGVDPRIADNLEASARKRGSAPADWRVSYHDVPVSKFLPNG